MADNNAPQNRQDDELSVEELEEASGGLSGDTININCPCTKVGFDEPANPAV